MWYYSPFSELDPPKVARWLSEDGFEPKFSLVYRLYYTWARPWIPIPLRQRLQRAQWSRREYRPDFIDPTMVDWVFSLDRGASRAAELYPQGYAYAVVLTHDVETREGLQRIASICALEERYGFRSSWNLIPRKYSVPASLRNELRARGHEVGVHGYRHDGRLFFSRQIFLRRAQRINGVLRDWNAVGFRAPMFHRHLVWMQALEILYDSSCFDYDVFAPLPGGVKSIWPFRAGRFIEIPCTLPQDHTLLVVLNQTDAGIWIRKSRWLIEHHGTIVLNTHPDYLNSPLRRRVYEELLSFLAEQPRGWHALPHELAAYWRDRWGGPVPPEITRAGEPK